MNKEILGRLRKAGEYEKLAIRSLLSERAVKHMEVIEKEVHTMFMEMVADAVRCEETDRNGEKASKVKKIDIG